MKKLKLEGTVITQDEMYAIIEFKRGAISFEENGTLYKNNQKFSIFVDSKGNVKHVTDRLEILITHGNFQKSELHRYMLASLLLWDGQALNKHIHGLVGVENEV